MAEINGKLVICDRCGATAFIACTGEGERDGGYTRWNNFEALPEGWDITRDCKKTFRLCPSCNKLYRDMIDNFESYTVEKESCY